jgi:hypothetical protein
MNQIRPTLDEQREIRLDVVNGTPQAAKNCHTAPQQIACAPRD